MGKDKIFTSCFTHDPWIAFILFNIGANSFPDILKNSGTASEMNTRKFWMLEECRCQFAARPGHKINYARREARFFKQLHKEITRMERIRTRLPDNSIAHKCWGAGQVASDSGEIK